MSNSRDQIYQLIDTMAADSSVASIIRTYTEEVCEPADNGHIVWCESTDPNISKFINYLLNVINVDKNIFSWVYCLIKYGDVYLKLYRESDYADQIFDQNKIAGVEKAKNILHESADKYAPEANTSLDESVNLNIRSTADPYSCYVEMVSDPGTMFELTKFGKTYGYIEVPVEETGINYLQAYQVTQTQPLSNYKMRSNAVNIYQADDFVHAYLAEGSNRYPEKIELFTNDLDYKNNTNATLYTVKHGKSLLIDSYKIWREKSLLENSILLTRITRSNIIRNIQVEVGDMPKSQVKNTLRGVKELFEQKTAINVETGMAEYTTPGPALNTVYTTMHEGKGAVSVSTVGTDYEVKQLADLDWWNNKFYSSYGIPKQYFGWTEDNTGFNGGTSLSILSSVFAKGVKGVQNAILQALTDLVSLICLNKGCKSYLNNFVLKMREPVTQEEKDYRATITDRINAISNLQALFADVETRSRKLKLLKNSLKGFSYDDNILYILDEEIKEAEAQEEANKEAANNSENNPEAAKPEQDTSNVDQTDLMQEQEPEIDLGTGAVATESFMPETNKESKIKLLEDNPILEIDELPSALDLHQDFTKNN